VNSEDIEVTEHIVKERDITLFLNSSPRLASLTYVSKQIKKSETLLNKSDLVLVHNEIYTQKWLGLDKKNNHRYSFFKAWHDNYVMCCSTKDYKGYAEYLFCPPRSIVLDNIFFSIYTDNDCINSIEDDSMNDISKECPIDGRSDTLDGLIENLESRWSDQIENFKKNNMPAYENSLIILNATKHLLNLFKMELDECGIQYRR